MKFQTLIRSLTLWSAFVLAGVLLVGCSRTVTWEEEVPLNTGETILVKRSGTYTYKPAPGNPLDYGWGPDWVSTIEFTYKGKKYSHTDDAGLVLLAIRPDGVPVLVASAAQFDWHIRNRYYCVTPYYVQFMPDATGEKWSWPSQIDPWLYDLPTNLIFGLVSLKSSGEKFTQAERVKKNASLLVVGNHYQRIDPAFNHQRCLRRE